MNKKGFTLIEVLAVIAILSILSIISITAIGNIKKTQDEQNDENTISAILSGAKKYSTDNRQYSGEIPVGDLKDKGYVKFDKDTPPDIADGSVLIQSCDNKLKIKYVLTYNAKTYNDCGCEGQTSGPSSTLCQN